MYRLALGLMLASALAFWMSSVSADTIVRHERTAYTQKPVKETTAAPEYAVTPLDEGEIAAEEQLLPPLSVGKDSAAPPDFLLDIIADAHDTAKPNPHINEAIWKNYPYADAVYAVPSRGIDKPNYTLLVRRQNAQPGTTSAYYYSFIVIADEGGKKSGSFDQGNLPYFVTTDGKITFNRVLAEYPNAIMLKMQQNTLDKALTSGEVTLYIPLSQGGEEEISISSSVTKLWEDLLYPKVR